MGNSREPRGEAEQQLGAAAEAGEDEGLLGGGQVWVRYVWNVGRVWTCMAKGMGRVSVSM